MHKEKLDSSLFIKTKVHKKFLLFSFFDMFKNEEKIGRNSLLFIQKKKDYLKSERENIGNLSFSFVL